MKTEEIMLYHGDCLEEMKKIPDYSIDLILCDLPYGTTACKWDTVIPFDKLWEQYKRIIKKNKAIVLFGSEPFSSLLRCSNLKEYKYDWYWQKSRPGGFVNAKLKPLKNVETISVFSNGMAANGSTNNMPYYPQGLIDCDVAWVRKNANISTSAVSPSRKSFHTDRTITKTNYPKQILEFANPNSKLFHPTQKPIDLLEYLIKTYTLENETVLDNTMGSGSTGVACVRTDRKFIGIEQDKSYFDIASKRINDEYDKYNLEIE